MGTVLNVLSGLFGIVALICWIVVLIRMFQRGRTAPAIASLVLILCGIGPLVAFVYGWLHVDDLGVRNIMLIWTICLLASFFLWLGGGVLGRQIGI
jgi:hypothetical protein